MDIFLFYNPRLAKSQFKLFDVDINAQDAVI